MTRMRIHCGSFAFSALKWTYLSIATAFVLPMGGDLFADSMSQAPQYMDTGLPNLSDRPASQDRSIDIFADALYWHATETVDWAYTRVSSPNFERATYKTLSFGWDPGFRVGLGYNMHHDQWDTQLTYTWFQTEATNRANGAVVSGFLAARLSLLEPFTTGKIRFNLHYNMFDWDLGRSFFVSRSLSLRPYIGLREDGSTRSNALDGRSQILRERDCCTLLWRT